MTRFFFRCIKSAVANAAAAAAAGGWGGESDREAVDEAVYDFAASFDADDDEGVAMGGYDVDDGVAGGGRGQTRRKGKVR